MLRGSSTPVSKSTKKLMPKGRVCDHDDCDTILSVHNRRKKCSVHEWTLGAPRLRGSKPAPAPVDEAIEDTDPLEEMDSDLQRAS